MEVMTILGYVAAAFIAVIMLALYACLAMAGRQDEAERRYAEAWKQEQGKSEPARTEEIAERDAATKGF